MSSPVWMLPSAESESSKIWTLSSAVKSKSCHDESYPGSSHDQSKTWSNHGQPNLNAAIRWIRIQPYLNSVITSQILVLPWQVISWIQPWQVKIWSNHGQPNLNPADAISWIWIQLNQNPVIITSQILVLPWQVISWIQPWPVKILSNHGQPNLNAAVNWIRIQPESSHNQLNLSPAMTSHILDPAMTSQNSI